MFYLRICLTMNGVQKSGIHLKLPLSVRRFREGLGTVKEGALKFF
jgi:hypothetical protein